MSARLKNGAAGELVARTAAIFIGGSGSRLGGVDKSRLQVGLKTIAQRQVQVLSSVFPSVVWIGHQSSSEVPPTGGRIADLRGPGLGPLSALETALSTLPDGEHAVVCVAGDLPFLAAPLLAHLRDANEDAVALVPRTQHGLEPLCARYDRSLLPLVTDLLEAGYRSLHQLLGGARVTVVDEPELRKHDPELRSFVNINTPEDLRAANANANESFGRTGG